MPPALPPLIGINLISFLALTSTIEAPFGSCWQVVKTFESSNVNIASLAPGQLRLTMWEGRRVSVLKKVRYPFFLSKMLPVTAKGVLYANPICKGALIVFPPILNWKVSTTSCVAKSMVHITSFS